MQLFFGIALSAFVLLQAMHMDAYEEDSQEQSDKTDSEAGSETSISLPQTIPNSASQINLGFDSYLLDEVTHSKETTEKSISSRLIVPRVHRAIQVLLRKIVSPNAP
ncbi:MAG: hypothetical protein ABJP45_15415 [Cyclobacteriaceae bacterium]